MKQKYMISSYNSFQAKIDYLLTACLYCWHLWISNIGRKIDKAYLYFFRGLVSTVVPRKYRTKIYRNILNSQEAIAPMFWDMECGQNIRIAKNLMYQTCTGYLAFPFSVVAGIASTIIGWDTVFYWKDGTIKFVTIILFVVFIAVGLSKLTKAIDDPQTCLSYFKEFEKQDEE